MFFGGLLGLGVLWGGDDCEFVCLCECFDGVFECVVGVYADEDCVYVGWVGCVFWGDSWLVCWEVPVVGFVCVVGGGCCDEVGFGGEGDVVLFVELDVGFGDVLCVLVGWSWF